MNILDLYYGLWAQMLSWSVFERAALIMGIISLIFYIIFIPFFMKIISITLRFLNTILKGVYCGIIVIAEGVMKKKGQMERAAVLNQISSKADQFSQRIIMVSDKVKKKKKISFFKVLVIYGVFLLFIGLPDFLGNKIEARYLPVFSSVSSLYQKMEQGALKKATYYPPLFREKEKEETAKELWLSLSPKGRNGANMRKKASIESKKIKVLSGDDKVLYLARKGSWVKIRLATGEEGFVNAKLLEGVPKK